MVSGNWLNNDGLYLQYGTSKTIPEQGGDYLVYGDNRELEVMINLAPTVFGPPAGGAQPLPALPSSFQGTIASQTALANTGIVSYTTLFPLQPTAPVTSSASGGQLNIINPQMWIDQIDVEVLVSANAGTGGATGITGIGLVTALGTTSSATSSAWAQITPNAGVQLMGAALNANLTVGKRWTFYPDASVIGSTNPPVAGSWLGNVPLVTLAETQFPGGLPNNAYISCIATGGAYTGTTAAGLLRLRVRYSWYGTSNDATQLA